MKSVSWLTGENRWLQRRANMAAGSTSSRRYWDNLTSNRRVAPRRNLCAGSNWHRNVSGMNKNQPKELFGCDEYPGGTIDNRLKRRGEVISMARRPVPWLVMMCLLRQKQWHSARIGREMDRHRLWNSGDVGNWSAKKSYKSGQQLHIWRSTLIKTFLHLQRYPLFR